MKYMKPQLLGYSAIASIQSVSNKQSSSGEPITDRPTVPAYEADE
jgi:hypothetical protein